MGKPYSGDLRLGVVRAVLSGQQDIKDVAARYKISERTAWRYVSHYRLTGDVDTLRQFGGHMKHVLTEHQTLVEKILLKKPDLSVRDLQRVLSDKNIEVSLSALQRFLKASGLR